MILVNCWNVASDNRECLFLALPQKRRYDENTSTDLQKARRAPRSSQIY